MISNAGMETLAQERRIHRLTIDMGNLCGMPTAAPGGHRATSVGANVNCPDCLQNADPAGARMAETWLYGPRDMPLDEDGTWDR